MPFLEFFHLLYFGPFIGKRKSKERKNGGCSQHLTHSTFWIVTESGGIYARPNRGGTVWSFFFLNLKAKFIFYCLYDFYLNILGLPHLFAIHLVVKTAFFKIFLLLSFFEIFLSRIAPQHGPRPNHIYSTLKFL